MENTFLPLLVALAIILGMIVALEAGRRLGLRHRGRTGIPLEGLGALEGAVFGLLGLLLAFTFSEAAGRFNVRREQIVEEANTIGTAWLRLDLLPPDARPALRDAFRRYVDARIDVFRGFSRGTLGIPEGERAAAIQAEIWNAAVAACRVAPPPTAQLVLPSLNDMIDFAATRTERARMHPPAVIYVTLCVLAFASSLVAGYGMGDAKTRSWFHTIAFALILGLAVDVILDLEFPRVGFIRIDAYDRIMVELRQSMK
ncbi:MAG TPA: DUF4239 domain-containing protein [Thermoanaerobaculia bacterium]|jgi:hypothetical protein